VLIKCDFILYLSVYMIAMHKLYGMLSDVCALNWIVL